MADQKPSLPTERTVVISGGTDGMGRALALARAARGDTVIAVGSSEAKGEQLLAAADALDGRIEVIRADLRTIDGNLAVIDRVIAGERAINALILSANRQSPSRVETREGLESTFALYYLSRYLLSYGLAPSLVRSESSVIVNIAGVGNTHGRVHWDDLQLRRRYRGITAQLQAGRANDLLGVAFATKYDGRAPYVLYHPGFTRSGDLGPLSRPARWMIAAAARIRARPINVSIAPVHDFIDRPPLTPLTAVDRGKQLPLSLKTLESGAAERLDRITDELVHLHLPTRT